LELEKQGLRERIVKKEDAPDRSFAIGRFDLVCEPIAKAAVGGGESLPAARGLVHIQPRAKASGKAKKTEQRELAELAICRNCSQYIYQYETVCPHCRADIAESKALWIRKRSQVLASQAKLERALAVLKEKFVSG
jgi:hypothetical protein